MNIVTAGNYDGVHRGHQSLLRVARAHAERYPGTGVAVITFDPHPADFFNPDPARAITRITTIARKVELLTAYGASRIIVKQFDHAFAAVSGEDFVANVIRNAADARVLVVGPDAAYGKGRSANVAALSASAHRLGFSLDVVPKTVALGETISSSRIRAAIDRGAVDVSAELLGHWHDVEGRVVRGQGRAAGMGFATANLEWPSTAMPKDGVYAVRARILAKGARAEAGDTLFDGIANLGTRPTVAAGRAFEVHLFNFEGNLYDSSLRVAFVRRVRDERKFSGLDALKAQIRTDVLEARAGLEARPREFDRVL